MYDKAKFWIDRAMVGDGYPAIANYLDEATYIERVGSDEGAIYGNFHGLKVSLYPNGISVVGSLPKFLHNGSNIVPIDRHGTKEVVEMISDGLHIPMDEAKVTGLEVGANLLLKHEPCKYLDRFGDTPYKTRIQVAASTINYRSTGKHRANEIAAYDKIQDANAKSMPIPVGFEGSNVLRFEIKYLRRVSKQFGREVTASTLCTPEFLREAGTRWHDAYFSISKNQINPINMEIKTPKDAFNAFVGHLIAQSGENVIDEFMKSLKDNNTFKTREEYKRAHKMITGTIKHGDCMGSDELIKELDNEVRNVVAFL